MPDHTSLSPVVPSIVAVQTILFNEPDPIVASLPLHGRAPVHQDCRYFEAWVSATSPGDGDLQIGVWRFKGNQPTASSSLATISVPANQFVHVDTLPTNLLAVLPELPRGDQVGLTIDPTGGTPWSGVVIELRFG